MILHAGKGQSRSVFLIGGIAIKIAWGDCHRDFLFGCLNNKCERDLYRQLTRENSHVLAMIARSYWCSWFGIIQIQRRAKPLARELSESEKIQFAWICNEDNKKENFGEIDGRIVCVDYP